MVKVTTFCPGRSCSMGEDVLAGAVQRHEKQGGTARDGIFEFKSGQVGCAPSETIQGDIHIHIPVHVHVHIHRMSEAVYWSLYKFPWQNFFMSESSSC